jgi:hypothetical protein
MVRRDAQGIGSCDGSANGIAVDCIGCNDGARVNVGAFEDIEFILRGTRREDAAVTGRDIDGSQRAEVTGNTPCGP